MKRLLLDTNIYGLLAADRTFHSIHQALQQQKNDIHVYGFSLIRKELKAAPKVLIDGVNVRASLLRAYDSVIVKEYSLSGEYKRIAEEYYSAYLLCGGRLPQEVLFNDFLIVACASKHEIPIVVSEDNATLVSELTKKAYDLVNTKRSLPCPRFIGYTRFKESILGARFSDPVINNSNKLWILLCFFYILQWTLFLSFCCHKHSKESLIYKSYVGIS